MKDKEEKSKIMEHECGYNWIPRVPKPRACPNCKRQMYYGDLKKTNPKK